MKYPHLNLVALCFSFVISSCGNPPPPPMEEPIAEGIATDKAPKAITEKVPMAKLGKPAGNETLYVAHLRNTEGAAIAGTDAMLLTEKPTAEFMRVPRRKFVIASYRSPKHGRVHFMVQSDSKPKYLWLGGNGFEPMAVKLENAVGGLSFERTIEIEIMPIATFYILDKNGDFADNALVTMKPADGNNFRRGSGSGNAGFTQRADDMGEVKFTRPPGKYIFVASNNRGKGKVTKTIEWDGDPAGIDIVLAQ
ncbi:MAG: hypothetical protein QGH51_04805 [Planctomycetota bacterium]|jgi:hypothetical protein|nr:hypothetical protein [Planctomycetota bacterium]MDP6941332.1 hypothetical protein [Planctomycetota bacterium]